LTIDRRSLLKALGVGAAAATLPAATDRHGSRAALASGDVGVTVSDALPGRPGTGADAPDWAALRAKLRGGLLLPGDAGYGLAKQAYNPLFDTHRPAAIARCARPEDVQACVELAATSSIPIAARSGGHSYAGYSTPTGGLVVDLGGMAGVRVRPDGTAVVGAGAKLIDVYDALARAGRCLPSGSCPTVGIAGLTLGGGLGVLNRKYGLTCDKLVSAEIVTADGRLRTASASTEPDLFWALRGGGGGNFGIVTSFTFATEPAPQLALFSLQFPAGSVPGVVDAWQDWIETAPDALWSHCVISAGSPPRCRVTGCFIGSPAALNRLLNSLLAKTGARPTRRDVAAERFLDAMLYFAGCSSETVAQCRLTSAGGELSRETFVASSAILPAPVANPARLVGLLNGRAGIDLLLDPLGGAVRRLRPDATAFPYRKALAVAQIYAGTTAKGQQRAVRMVSEVRSGLEAIVGRAAFVNYIDPRMPGWGSAYYDGNLAKLRRVAKRYDPDGVFDFPQSVIRA
jgi:hypothetical protein